MQYRFILNNKDSISTIVGIITVCILIIITLFTIQNAYRLSKIVSTGQYHTIISKPLYGFMRIPDGFSNDASGRFGGDYSCLYFNSKNYFKNSIMYDEVVDPWHRPAVTFPPILIFLTSRTLQFLNFPLSVMLSNYFQILCFFLASIIYIQDKAKKWKILLFGAVFTCYLIFMTPVGETWFERSQTDLYMASAIVFFLKGLRDRKWIDFILTGIFASLKWSSLPFLAIVGVAYFLFYKERRKWFLTWLCVVFAVVFSLSLIFWKNFLIYLSLVKASEFNWETTGISLGTYFPIPLLNESH